MKSISAVVHKPVLYISRPARPVARPFPPLLLLWSVSASTIPALAKNTRKEGEIVISEERVDHDQLILRSSDQLFSMSRGGSGKLHLHISWLWRAPRRALCAARDLYVRSLTGCAGHLPGDAAFGYPTFAAAAPTFRADSFASSAASRRSADDEDLRELIRAASQRRAEELAAAAAARHPAAVPRSQSVAMARIDEDRPCEFGGAGVVVFPRSRSCAVGAGRRGRVAALAA